MPIKLSMNFSGVDGVAGVVPWSVLDIMYKWQGVPLWVAEETVYGGDKQLHELNILQLVMPSDIVGLSHLSCLDDLLYSADVVYDV